MNYQEAIGKLLYIKSGHIPDWGNKQDEYYSMHEAINTAISAMQELKEYKEYGTPNGYCCCGIVGIDDMRADYCADCGQHIDWSEVEE